MTFPMKAGRGSKRAGPASCRPRFGAGGARGGVRPAQDGDAVPEGTRPLAAGCPAKADPRAGRGGESGSGHGGSTRGRRRRLTPAPAFHEKPNLFFKNANRFFFFFFLWGVLYNLEFKAKKQRNQHNKGINKETNQNIYPGFGSSYTNLLQGAPGPVASACSLGLVWD